MVDTLSFALCLFLVTVVYGGEFCTKSSYGSEETLYCPTTCCGSRYNRYCCDGNIGLIIGIVIGVLALVAVVVTIFVVVFCCCRKSRGQTGQVVQTTTVPVYGVQATVVSTPVQVGYPNVAYPQQMPTTNIPYPGPVDTGAKWQEAPPPYNTATSS